MRHKVAVVAAKYLSVNAGLVNPVGNWPIRRNRPIGLLITCGLANSMLQVKLLLEAKAGVNVRDEYGRTALHLATANGHEVVVKLLEAGSKSCRICCF